jgi:hypothetical protein
MTTTQLAVWVMLVDQYVVDFRRGIRIRTSLRR